jgi:hypothetical protein
MFSSVLATRCATTDSSLSHTIGLFAAGIDSRAALISRVRIAMDR